LSKHYLFDTIPANIKRGYMKNIQKTVSTLLLAVGLLAGVAITTVSAATSTTGNGMRVAPVRSDLTMQPGSTKVISVFVTNVTGATATYKVLRNDFVSSNDEAGSPALLLNGEINDQHGLKKYMSSVDQVSVAAGKQKEIKVTIAIPKGTPGGGYYGAVRFAQTSPEGKGNLSLSGSVASLILVRVPGDVVEKLSLVSFDARTNDEAKTVFTSGKNIEAVVRFRNEGNIQEQPFGKVLLKKGSKVLGTYEINGGNQPGNVLPENNHVRRFSVDLKDVGSFGKYTLEGNFGYGSAGQLLSAKTTFYVIPMWAIVIGLVIIAAILFLIFGLPRLLKNYNKRILRKAGRR
jgi:hypothetical protein